MWNPWDLFAPKPRLPEEHCWRFVSRWLVWDAKLFADGLEAARRPRCGSWARMMIECEIAAVRIRAITGALSIGSKEWALHMLEASEWRLRQWLHRKRKAELAVYAAFHHVTVADAVDTLSQHWQRYPEIPPEQEALAGTLRAYRTIFRERCITAYTNKPLDDFAGQGERKIDVFVPTYLKAQVDWAIFLASKTPEMFGLQPSNESP